MNTTSARVLRILEDKRGESVSGNDIARDLNISRNAVWKAVRMLRDEGFMISARQNLGYCLSTLDDNISEVGIKRYISDDSIKLYVLKETESTNDYLKLLARQGARDKSVVVADSQSSGKGRRGKSFFSPVGKGLYISFLFRPEFSASMSLIVTAAAASATASAIESVINARDVVTIKWVNDLYLNGKKISGILTEASLSLESGCAEYLVLGIGINVHRTRPPKEIWDIYGALFESSPGGVRNRLAGQVINSILDTVARLGSDEKETARRIIEDGRRRSCVIGREVTVYGSNEVERGKAVDIDENGRLVVIDPAGKKHALSAGEISIGI